MSLVEAVLLLDEDEVPVVEVLLVDELLGVACVFPDVEAVVVLVDEVELLLDV